MDVDYATTPFADHKLSGFLYAVLAVTSPVPPNEPLPFGSRFRIYGPDVSFRSENDAVVLSPVHQIHAVENAAVDSEERRTRMKMRKRSIGLVNGSISVVHQIHALVMNKCIKVDALLVRIEADGGGDVRAVLLVDVYLPIQFDVREAEVQYSFDDASLKTGVNELITKLKEDGGLSLDVLGCVAGAAGSFQN